MKRAYICSYTEQVTLWSRHTINYPGLGNKFRYATQAAGFFLYAMLDVTHRMPLLRKRWKFEVFPKNKKTSFMEKSKVDTGLFYLKPPHALNPETWLSFPYHTSFYEAYLYTYQAQGTKYGTS